MDVSRFQSKIDVKDKVDKYSKYVKEIHSPPVKPKKDEEKKRSSTGNSPKAPADQKPVRQSINHSELRKAHHEKRIWEINKPKPVLKPVEDSKIHYKDYLKDIRTNRNQDMGDESGGNRSRMHKSNYENGYLERGALSIFQKQNLNMIEKSDMIKE